MPVEKKQRHPKTSEMVNSAIKNLKERRGSSLRAITKYIESTYGIESKNYSTYIKTYIKKSLSDGTMLQAKGIGLTGSFKLSKKVAANEGKKEKKKVAAKDTVAEQPKKSKIQKDDTKNAKTAVKKDKKPVTVMIAKPKKVKTGEKEKKTKEKTAKVKKGRVKTVTTTDAANLKKVRLSIVNGKLIKKKSLGVKISKKKKEKATEEQ